MKKLSEDIYKKLSKKGYDVLYDDRNESASIKFKDADLIGIPLQIVIGEKNAKKGLVELKLRKSGKVEALKPESLESHLKTLMLR